MLGIFLQSERDKYTVSQGFFYSQKGTILQIIIDIQKGTNIQLVRDFFTVRKGQFYRYNMSKNKDKNLEHG